MRRDEWSRDATLMRDLEVWFRARQEVQRGCKRGRRRGGKRKRKIEKKKFRVEVGE